MGLLGVLWDGHFGENQAMGINLGWTLYSAYFCKGNLTPPSYALFWGVIFVIFIFQFRGECNP